MDKCNLLCSEKMLFDSFYPLIKEKGNLRFIKCLSDVSILLTMKKSIFKPTLKKIVFMFLAFFVAFIIAIASIFIFPTFYTNNLLLPIVQNEIGGTATVGNVTLKFTSNNFNVSVSELSLVGSPILNGNIKIDSAKCGLDVFSALSGSPSMVLVDVNTVEFTPISSPPSPPPSSSSPPPPNTPKFVGGTVNAKIADEKQNEENGLLDIHASAVKYLLAYPFQIKMKKLAVKNPESGMIVGVSDFSVISSKGDNALPKIMLLVDMYSGKGEQLSRGSLKVDLKAKEKAWDGHLQLERISLEETLGIAGIALPFSPSNMQFTSIVNFSANLQKLEKSSVECTLSTKSLPWTDSRTVDVPIKDFSMKLVYNGNEGLKMEPCEINIAGIPLIIKGSTVETEALFKGSFSLQVPDFPAQWITQKISERSARDTNSPTVNVNLNVNAEFDKKSQQLSSLLLSSINNLKLPNKTELSFNTQADLSLLRDHFLVTSKISPFNLKDVVPVFFPNDKLGMAFDIPLFFDTRIEGSISDPASSIIGDVTLNSTSGKISNDNGILNYKDFRSELKYLKGKLDYCFSLELDENKINANITSSNIADALGKGEPVVLNAKMNCNEMKMRNGLAEILVSILKLDKDKKEVLVSDHYHTQLNTSAEFNLGKERIEIRNAFLKLGKAEWKLGKCLADLNKGFAEIQFNYSGIKLNEIRLITPFLGMDIASFPPIQGGSIIGNANLVLDWKPEQPEFAKVKFELEQRIDATDGEIEKEKFSFNLFKTICKIDGDQKSGFHVIIKNSLNSTNYGMFVEGSGNFDLDVVLKGKNINGSYLINSTDIGVNIPLLFVNKPKGDPGTIKGSFGVDEKGIIQSNTEIKFASADKNLLSGEFTTIFENEDFAIDVKKMNISEHSIEAHLSSEGGKAKVSINIPQIDVPNTTKYVGTVLSGFAKANFEKATQTAENASSEKVSKSTPNQIEKPHENIEAPTNGFSFFKEADIDVGINKIVLGTVDSINGLSLKAHYSEKRIDANLKAVDNEGKTMAFTVSSPDGNNLSLKADWQDVLTYIKKLYFAIDHNMMLALGVDTEAIREMLTLFSGADVILDASIANFTSDSPSIQSSLRINDVFLIELHPILALMASKAKVKLKEGYVFNINVPNVTYKSFQLSIPKIEVTGSTQISVDGLLFDVKSQNIQFKSNFVGIPLEVIGVLPTPQVYLQENTIMNAVGTEMEGDMWFPK